MQNLLGVLFCAPFLPVPSWSLRGSCGTSPLPSGSHPWPSGLPRGGALRHFPPEIRGPLWAHSDRAALPMIMFNTTKSPRILRQGRCVAGVPEMAFARLCMAGPHLSFESASGARFPDYGRHCGLSPPFHSPHRTAPRVAGVRTSCLAQRLHAAALAVPGAPDGSSSSPPGPAALPFLILPLAVALLGVERKCPSPVVILAEEPVSVLFLISTLSLDWSCFPKMNLS